MSRSPLLNVAVARVAERLPVLRRMPLARLVIVAELAMLAKDHLDRLTPTERRRLVVLVTQAKGWPRNLGTRERHELERLVHKIEPRAFAMRAVEKFVPVRSRRRSG